MYEYTVITENNIGIVMATVNRLADDGWRIINVYGMGNYHYAILERKEITLQDQPEKREI